MSLVESNNLENINNGRIEPEHTEDEELKRIQECFVRRQKKLINESVADDANEESLLAKNGTEDNEDCDEFLGRSTRNNVPINEEDGCSKAKSSKGCTQIDVIKRTMAKLKVKNNEVGLEICKVKNTQNKTNADVGVVKRKKKIKLKNNLLKFRVKKEKLTVDVDKINMEDDDERSRSSEGDTNEKSDHRCPRKFRVKKENRSMEVDKTYSEDDEEGSNTSEGPSDENSDQRSPETDTSCEYNTEDMMETSPIECEVQIKTEPGDQDITVDPGLYNGPIGEEEIFPGIHMMPRPPFVYDPDDTYRKAKKLELEKLQVEKAPRHACDHCDRIFYLQSKLKKHMQSHLEDRPYPCPICDSSHKTDYDLKSHLITHSSQRPYVCPECPASFKRPSSLKSHLHVHSPIRSFACNECQANFKRKSDLLSHMPLHSEVRPFSCNKCSALFKTEKGLKCHVKTHDSRPMTVRRRPRNTSAELARISELVSNDPSMTPGKDRYLCNECFVEFNKRETLIKHMLVHSSVREFSCSQCTKTFKRRADLRSHMTVHSDYKPYSCEHCTATFKRTIEVKFHMRVHASPVQYTCTACQIVFKSKVQLSRHRSTVHKQPNYRNHCTMCEHSFRTKPELNQHLLEHCKRLQEIKEEAES